MVFVAVHIGAGYHSMSKRKKYQQICNNACEAALRVLNNDNSMTSVDAVTEAIIHLENETMTNAGLGSNLNIVGQVECDASLMDGSDLLFGSVGAIQSIKNPIKVAELILKQQRTPPPLGLIAPNFLVAEGARKFAIQNGLPEYDLISENSLTTHQKYKRQLDACNDQAELPNKHQRYDTVGAVCMDHSGCLSSGVSSGGLILKPEGRIGQASIIGAGTWTQNNVAVTSSGVGEYLVRTLLARKTVECISSSTMGDFNTLQRLIHVFDEHFFGSPLMKNVSRDDHLAGVLGLQISKSDQNADDNFGNLELFWAHSTASMCIGYMDASFSSAKSFVCQLDPGSKPGMTINAQTKVFKCTLNR